MHVTATIAAMITNCPGLGSDRLTMSFFLFAPSRGTPASRPIIHNSVVRRLLAYERIVRQMPDRGFPGVRSIHRGDPGNHAYVLFDCCRALVR